MKTIILLAILATANIVAGSLGHGFGISDLNYIVAGFCIGTLFAVAVHMWLNRDERK